MNPKTTVILLVVFVLAIVALVLVPQVNGPRLTGKTDTDNTTNNDKPLLTEKQLGNNLKRITFDGGLRGTMLRLERINGRWRVTQPTAFPAKQGAVDELLGVLAGITGSATDQHSGLVPDGRSLTLEFNDTDEPTWLGIGDRLGAGRAVISTSPGDHLQSYETQDTLHDLFDNFDPAVFYAGKIDPPLMPEVQRIEITTPDGVSALTQQGGRWWIGQGEQAERALEDDLGDRPGVSALFKLIQAIELTEPQPQSARDGLAAFGLGDPLIRVRFVPVEEARSERSPGMEIRVGVPGDPHDQTRYIAIGAIGDSNPAVFKTASNMALTLSADTKSFRDPRITTIPASLIASIDLMGGRGDVDDRKIMFHADHVPTLIVPNAVPAAKATVLDPQACSAMLSLLTGARAIDYVRAPAQGASRINTAFITSRLSDKAEAITILPDPESKQDAPTVLIQRDDEAVALRVLRSTVAGLIAPSLLFSDDTE